MPSQSRVLRLPTLFTLLLGTAFLVLDSPVSADATGSGANSKRDLICRTSDPEDCYPRVFEPTDEFQKVHDDQEIPHGLHVRLNVYTGEKEAKINVPGEGDASLQGLPVEQDVVVVEPEARDVPIVPKGAPVYETAGKIKGPQHEAQSFLDGMKLIKSSKGDQDSSFDAGLEGVEDLAHDMYYGLKVAEDTEAVKALLCRMSHSSDSHTEGFPPRDQQAAAILAGSLQNNPTALAAVTKAWPSIMDHRCPADDQPLRSTFFQSIAPPQDAAETRVAAGRVKAKVAALSGLIKEPTIRADFLRNDGMRELLRVLVVAPEEKGWATAQRKVGLFVADNFLDEDMGAVTGQWPTGPKLSDDQCKKEEWRTAEGCWDYNVARIVKANRGDKGHWSKGLQKLLAEARKGGKVAQHAEL